MDEHRYLPNYDPDFCLKVTKWGAVSCVAWLILTLLILGLVDPSGCPGWIIHSKNGQASSLRAFFGIFTALPTIWICFIVVRWKHFSQKVYDSAADSYQPFMMPKLLYERFKPDPVIFPYNRVFVVTIVGWSLFCTNSLWMMLGNCTNLFREVGF
jgi:hypothetical protein